MEDTTLPLTKSEAEHTLILNGQQKKLKLIVKYDESELVVEVVEGEEWATHLLSVPLLFSLEFREQLMIRSSHKSWKMDVSGNGVKTTESITFKADKEQIINANVCSSFLTEGEGKDCVLACQFYKIYVNTKKLAEKSDYFKALFYGDFKEKNESSIEMGEMEGEVLHAIVMLTHNARYRITDFNVEAIMGAADRLSLVSVFNSCVDHLSIHSKLGEFVRLRLLDHYRQDDCIDELIEMIQCHVTIRENPLFDSLSLPSQLKVLRPAVAQLKKKIGSA